MNLKTRLFGQTFTFKDVKEVLSKANEIKSGDILAGIAAENAAERIAAKRVLSELTLEDLRLNPVIPLEEDEVSRIIDADVNEPIYHTIKNWSVAEFREYILTTETTGSHLRRLSRGLTSEMVAAVAKLMSNLDLILGAAKIQNLAHCNTTIGKTGCLASRLQPNHPTDGVDGILTSLREGLSYGVGDAVFGLNPVDDSMPATIRSLETLYQFVEEWKVPTQICVLAHISTQIKALRKGAPVHLLFQSIAGSQTGNEAFGVSKEMLDEAYTLGLKEGRATGPNIMYFETGQGSELSSEAHHGADQVTLEARCYGLARHYNPFLVNTVVGFIGPEYLYDTRQVTRAGLEDHFMGKLSGLPMGVDACYTNHMKADQNDIENLATLLTAAGCTYFMGIPMGDDVMLNYQCTSYHDIATLRELFRLRPLPEFEAWAESMGIMAQGKLTARAGDATIFTR
ncbi:ethanolamine ammonia-lyase subunit EutB [Desulfosporosinus sp. BICA1-9]|uniref:ethanolamine ammonia-lyase subunit EutB n=1 Tax=Desulfosporosinus sp. BICA1-9 TaxID=1531958 RepID=UPI00054B81D2|nr:ethanolamine ammonia-lyase subunit EutB [Desulfosporosinus sp. BICA1-9]KJS81192.1 MAG: ethanolamine ammonia-lyase [Desulfosporosinus sp. BICA1-9]HBW37537.1 ethanolamine ammonia-lyase subunit EutB [Desulfosporosinus sp.]